MLKPVEKEIAVFNIMETDGSLLRACRIAYFLCIEVLYLFLYCILKQSKV